MKKILIGLLFLTSQITNAQVTDTGDKVGVGTTTPNHKLEVTTSGATSTALRLNNASWASGMSTSLEFKNGVIKTVPTSMIRDYMSGSGNAGGELQFWTQEYSGTNPNVNAMVQRMTIDDTGKVGVGTINPNERFTVHRSASGGSYNVAHFGVFDGVSRGITIIGTSSGGGYVGFGKTTSAPYAFRNSVNSSSIVTISDTGKGTFNGGVLIPNNKHVKSRNSSGVEGTIMFVGGDNTMISGDYSNVYGDYRIFTSATERMRVKSNGNIGIGTTTPDSKLSVNGNIHTKEVRVDLTGWSDFVFEELYDLPSLSEVENHIKKNGHLKDIPSAKEVEDNGILLGEMNAKLLQKIEELTLYTIEQEKKLVNQKESFENQKKEIETLKTLVQQLIQGEE